MMGGPAKRGARAPATNVSLLAIGVALASCTFDQSGIGEGNGGNTLDTASTGEASSSAASVDDATSSAGEAGDASTSGDTSGIGELESGAPGGAMLTLAEAPSYDYGPVPLGQALSHGFTVSNIGDGPAEALVGQLAPPFAFAGGTWPGTNGTCGDTLEGGTACTIDIAFAPSDLGETIGMLAIDYVDQGAPGSVLVALRGGGAGQSTNLVVNGGGEMLGDPPLGWFDVLGGAWATTNAYFHGGAVSIFPWTGNNLADLELAQPLVVSQWASAIDLGTLRFRMTTFARTLSLTDDAYRVRLEFLDMNGQALDAYDTEYQGFATGWNEVEDDRLAPVGTRSLRIVLMCVKASGSNCNAYYDDVSVVAAYP
jgi:hypothetical protein